MAVRPIAYLKNKFLTGLKPLQEDFHDWLDSFWHVSAPIPTSAISGLPAMLDGKVSLQTVAEQSGGLWTTTGRFGRMLKLGVAVFPIPVGAGEICYYAGDPYIGSGGAAVKMLTATSGIPSYTAYTTAKIWGGPVYAPQLYVQQTQVAGLGHAQEWSIGMMPKLSLIGADDPVYSGSRNYMSSTSTYRGYMLGIGLKSHGSTGDSVPNGCVVFHTDSTSMRISISAKTIATSGIDLDASAGIQIDTSDAVYFRGTTNAGLGAGDYLLSMDGATGKAAKTRSVAKSYTPTGTADTYGELGELVQDGSYVYVKTSAGWRRAAMSSF